MSVCVCACVCTCGFELVLFRDSVRVDGTGAASIMEVSFQEVPVTEEQDNQSELKVLLLFFFYDILLASTKKLILEINLMCTIFIISFSMRRKKCRS